MKEVFDTQQLVRVMARLIRDNDLHKRHGEDTIGILVKCGAFHENRGDEHFIVELAHAIDLETKEL